MTPVISCEPYLVSVFSACVLQISAAHWNWHTNTKLLRIEFTIRAPDRLRTGCSASHCFSVETLPARERVCRRLVTDPGRPCGAPRSSDLASISWCTHSVCWASSDGC